MSARATGGGAVRNKCTVCGETEKHGKGYLLRDTKEAEMVCADCGACTAYIVPENCHTYSESLQRQVCQDACPRKEEDVRANMEFLEQYNSLPGSSFSVPTEQLAWIARVASLPQKEGRGERCVAAAFVADIEAFFDFDEVERCVRARLPLPIMQYTPPPCPSFQCSRCGARVHTRWEARRHPCGWGKKRKIK